MPIRHKFRSLKADSQDITLVNPSNWNDDHDLSGFPLVFASDYVFTPQQINTTLTPGNNTITLSPVPKGISGTNIGSKIRIGNEAATIMGGTAISGAPTGTLIVSVTSAHPATDLFQTATAGIQEAHNANPGAIIRVPVGNYNVYGSIISNGHFNMLGDGPGSTFIRWNSVSGPLLNIQKDYFEIANLTLQQVSTPVVAGNCAISITGTASNVTGANADWGFITNVQVLGGFYNGIVTQGGTQSLDLTRIDIANCVQDGIVSHGSQGYWVDVISENNGGNGITLTVNNAGGGGTTLMSGIQTFNNQGWGLYATSIVYISGLNSFFNADKAGEIYIKTNSIQSGWITDAAVQYAGQSVSWGTNNVAPGIWIDIGSGAMVIDNVQFFGDQGNDIMVETGWHIISNCYFFGGGAGGQPQNIYSILTKVVVSQLTINNNYIASAYIGGNQNHIIDNQFQGTLVGPLLEIPNNSLGTVISRNFFYQAGVGPALVIDPGCTISPPFDNVFFNGALVNNGTINAQVEYRASNYTAGTGATNAIIASIANVGLADGLRITLLLSFALTGGATNTLNLNGTGVIPIRSSRTPTNNIATGYGFNAVIQLQYLQPLNVWVDLSQ